MITLYTYGPAFGLADPSPFVMKAQRLLDLAGLPYQQNARGLRGAPKGKLPWIDDDGTVIADSTLIRFHLERKYGIDFDKGLSARERGIAWAVEKMLEDHLYWHMIYWRWLKEENFARGPEQFFRRAPAIIRPLVIRAVLKSLRRTLHGQGVGRHSDEEKNLMAARAVDSLSQVLGDNRYLMGDSPCGADATVSAFVAAGLCPLFDSPLRRKLEATPNLVAYAQKWGHS